MSKAIVAVDVCNLNLSSLLQYQIIINELQAAGENVLVYIGPIKIPKEKGKMKDIHELINVYKGISKSIVPDVITFNDIHELINIYKSIFKSIVPDVVTFNDLQENMNLFLQFVSNLTKISVDTVMQIVKTNAKETLYTSDLFNPIRFVTDISVLKPNLLVASESILRIYDLIDDSKKCLRRIISEVPTFKTSLLIQDDDKTISSKVNGTFCNDDINNSIYLQTSKLIIPYLGHILIDGVVYDRDNFESEFARINKKSLKMFISKFFASYRDRIMH